MDSESKQETEHDAILNLRRKLNALENERLTVMSSSNEEISQLLSEVARLTAQLERGEALRQNLEYELARSKKENLTEKKTAEDRHSEMKKLIEECTRKEEKNISEKKMLAKELEAIRAATQEDISRFASLMQEKEKQLLVLLKEKDCLNAEKSKLTLIIMDRESAINEYKAELDRFAAHGRQTESNLWSKVEELKEQNSVLEQELLLTLTKVESLESANEVERKNHSETKCSFDVLQNEVKAESAAKADALLKVEKLQDHLRQSQESLEEEKTSSSKLQEKLANLEREFENVKRQLSSELSDKKHLAKSYSQQLEECQKTAIQLRQELSKAKKKQLQLDEAYNGGLKQLQEVIAVSGNSLSPSSLTSVRPTPVATGLAKEVAKASNFFNLASSIQQIFCDRLQQQEKLSRDLSSHQQMVEQLTRECRSLKLTMSTTAKACQMSNEALEKCKGEKSQLEKQLVCLKEECSRLHSDLSTLKTSLAKEKSCSQQLQAQMVKLTKRYQNDEQRSSTFVLLLHQLLNTVDAVAAISGKCITSKDGALPRWNDLGLVVNEQVSSLVNLLNQEKEKVSRLEELLRQRERMLEQHNEELAKIAKTYESANQQWTGEKEEIQKKFIKKLSAVHSKLKVSAEETWQKMETATVYQQELEQDREKLLGQLSACRIESSALLAACALLCGTVYPLHARYVALLEQRAALNNQLAHFEAFKSQVRNLIVAISGERCDTDPKMSVARTCNLAPRLRFRVAVIAVIAVKRLSGYADNSCQIFTSFNTLPGVYATAVCIGSTTALPKGESFEAGRIDRLSNWLSSADLHSAIHSSMHDLVMATDRIRERASGYERTQLLNIAKNCFQKFLSFLPKIFPLISVYRGSHSFCTDLGRGLEACLGSSLNTSHMSYVDSQQLAKSLQQELLNFTRRLHVSELERRDLRAALSLVERGDVGKKEKELTDRFNTAVPVDKFTEVCEELARALEHEEQLQRVLAMQKEEMEKQAKRLYTLNDNGVRQENLASAAGRHLSDLRVELNSKDLLVQRLTRQIAIIDEEKASLMNKISDAEIALQTAAEEKRSVICFANTLSNWFKQMPSAKNGKWAVDELLDFELSETKSSCPQLSAVRCLLVAFIETLNSVFESRSFGCDSCSVRDMKPNGGNMNRKFHPEIRVSKSRDSFRPFVIDSDPGPLRVKLNVKESKNSQKKAGDKKPKSKLPKHQGLRALTHRVMSSQRNSSSETGPESGSMATARIASKLIS